MTLPAEKQAARRFVIEGEWSGYVSRQRRIVHRQVYPAHRKALRAWVETHPAIVYTDGTALYLTVRDCKPRERVTEINGYTSLIEQCAHENICHVANLSDVKKARSAP